MPDTRIIGNGQNATGGTVATDVVSLARRNALSVILVNSSGDVYNAGPGQGQDGATVDGANSAIRGSVLSGPTTRPTSVSNPVFVQLSDDPTRQLGVTSPSVVGVQVVGGAVGGSVSITGDVAIRQDATNTPKGTLSTPIGVQVIGGSIGGKFSSSGDTLNTSQQGVVGVQIIGGSVGGKFSSSGDTINTSQQGVVGVQVVGGQVGGSHGVSGDVSIKPSVTTNVGNFPVSGDQAIVDGVTRGTKATVRGYANSNPVAVALTNASGDVYSPTPKEPICPTIPFNITSTGTTTLAGPYNGRVIKVIAYDLQGSSDIATAQGHFGSAASGSALTHDWLFAVREGVAKQIPGIGGGYYFKTLLNQSLVFELSAGSMRGSVTFHTGDSF